MEMSNEMMNSKKCKPLQSEKFREKIIREKSDDGQKGKENKMR